jgi:tRNA(fMet)-specific endonuclease VapC
LTYLLDSNVCIRLINNSSPAVTSRLTVQQPSDILVSTITQLELYYGAYRSAQIDRNLEILQRFFVQFNIIHFDSKSAKIAGRIRADLAAMGTPIGSSRFGFPVSTSHALVGRVVGIGLMQDLNSAKFAILKNIAAD